MSKNTVRLWLRRFQEEGNDGLLDRRSGPNHILHKTSKESQAEVIKIRTMAPCYGPKRIKGFFGLEPSVGAIQRIIKDHGLVKKRRRKYQKKNDLRAIKALYKAFEKVQRALTLEKTFFKKEKVIDDFIILKGLTTQKEEKPHG